MARGLSWHSSDNSVGTNIETENNSHKDNHSSPNYKYHQDQGFEGTIRPTDESICIVKERLLDYQTKRKNTKQKAQTADLKYNYVADKR